jgi:hypothetical protein
LTDFSTSIRFDLTVTSDVKLLVFDILGRQVSVLVNERRDAEVHKVKSDAAGLSSGVYFYRLRAGDFVQTKKLLLVRLTCGMWVVLDLQSQLIYIR